MAAPRDDRPESWLLQFVTLLLTCPDPEWLVAVARYAGPMVGWCRDMAEGQRGFPKTKAALEEAEKVDAELCAVSIVKESDVPTIICDV